VTDGSGLRGVEAVVDKDLAAALPYGQAARIPGNHMSAVAQPDLGQAIAAFLAGG